MYEVSESFISAIDNYALQHIRGSITGMRNVVVTLNDNNLTDKISTYSQCVSDSSQFGIGGMYIGYCQCVLYGDVISLIDRMDGARISLDFGLEVGEDDIEWIPLGVWNVDEAVKESNDRVRIKASDNLAKLKVNTEQSKVQFIGVVQIRTLMSYVTQITGVQFEQTVEELETLFDRTLESRIFATSYPQTCWKIVQDIATILGGFAFANRSGKIEFRRLDGYSVLSVPASMRHKAQLERYTYTVGEVAYLDKYGYTVTHRIQDGSTLTFSNCDTFMWDRDEEQETQYGANLGRIADALGNVSFTPGEISYYGNPALDVGDCITLTDGIADEEKEFLVCCNSWQFRGPQTLTACGNSAVQGSSYGGIGYSSSSADTSAQRIRHITGESVAEAGVLVDTELSSVSFGCRAQTYVVFQCDMVIAKEYDGNAEISVKVEIDGEDYGDYAPSLSVSDNLPLSLSVPADLDGGQHTIKIKATGDNVIISQLHCFVWGQGITVRSAEPTDSSDYIYYVENNQATICMYIGDSTYPAVPDKLGGYTVTRIVETAFNYRDDIEGVEIPESVVEIC